MEYPRTSFNQKLENYVGKTRQLWKLIWKLMTIIDNRFDDFYSYSIFNTVLLCLTLSTMYKLYQKTVICFENGFFKWLQTFKNVTLQILNFILLS